MELSHFHLFSTLVVSAYLIGSIPWGLVLTRTIKSIDIRTVGSGNIGATNVMRTAGVPLGLLTLAGDMLKGSLPVWVALIISDPNDTWRDIYVSLVVLAAFCGHLYPVYLKFKDGGKGVATAAGCFCVISPLVFVIVLFVFAGVVFWRNHVSVGSLTAAAVLPFTVWLTLASKVLTACALVVSIFIFIRHRDNIRRLVAGTEPVARAKK